MSHTYSVVPQPLVSPLYRAGERSDFSCSSAPTSPHAPRPKSSAFKRHIRHKSSPPANRAKLPLLNDCDFYPSGKHPENWAVRARANAVPRVVALKDDSYNAPSNRNSFSPERSHLSRQVDEQSVITVGTCHNDDQFLIKVNTSRFAKYTKSAGDKRHRQIYPKDEEFFVHEDRIPKCHVFRKDDTLPPKCEREATETNFVRDQRTVTDLPNNMITEPESTMVVYADNPQMTFVAKEKHITVRSSLDDVTKDGNGEEQQEIEKYSIESENMRIEHIKNTRSVEIQVSPSPQYRLRFLPICGCTADESEWEFCQCCFIVRLVGRWAFSQCGLGLLLLIWALLGAAAFHSTEAPHEERQALELSAARTDLEVELSTELRHLEGATGSAGAVPGTEHPLEPLWRQTIGRYFKLYEGRMLLAVKEGYGEGGGGGKIWSYAGCLLFAVSLLTTLDGWMGKKCFQWRIQLKSCKFLQGFGAPVPRTTLGRIAAVVFSAIGIPLHLLLVLNIGMLIAVKLQNLSMTWQQGTSFLDAMAVCCFTNNIQDEGHTAANENISQGPGERMECSRYPDTHFTAPRWLKLFPAVAIMTYYIFGVIVFGAARSRPFSDCLLFPLDFTASGGVGLTSSTVRTCYAIYLEGAVILAASAVAVWQVSATKGLTNLGLKLGLLTNS